MKKLIYIVICFSFCIHTGCNTIPKGALALEEQSMEWRQTQSRRFDTDDEELLLSACANLMQDLGFTLEESETDLGLLVGSKDRDAVEGGQVAGAVFMALLTGVATPIDDRQNLKLSIVARPFGEEQTTTVIRVTFQRIVWNTQGQVSKLERLNDPEQYQEFFELLSKAVFLEANEI